MLTRACTRCDGTGKLGDRLLGPCECGHEGPCPDCDDGQVEVRCWCAAPAVGYDGDGEPLCKECAKRDGRMLFSAEELAVVRATEAHDRAVLTNNNERTT